ncbi:Rieske (2Fe-2S) domain-containing protein [Candidatus Protofrankia californiensis]|uniref:Rieske (2Fe-2S) domain-containing protein n=1 Tax=Candidatus Protofrankia californiensis TaxID=1839754 RepID=A0A1C3NWB4_9ACTN|nr:Rieske (2Fe-2S) domain-containing protein [Candidatus Protofrankia californiensis]
MTNTNPSLRHGWHPVALSSGIGDEPVSVRLLGDLWVIARLDDRVTALADRCPHLLAPPSTGRPDAPQHVCPYHGWRFVASGACTAMSAPGSGALQPERTRAAPAWGATERHGLVWIAPEEPFADIIDLPEAGDPTFDSRWLDVTRSPACAAVLADDLLDAANLPFVHPSMVCTDPIRTGPIRTGAGGAGEQTITLRRSIAADSDGFRIKMEQMVTNSGKPAVAAGPRPPGGRHRSTCTYRPPFQLRLVLECPDAGITSTIFFCLQPEDAASTRIYARLLRNDLGGNPDRLTEAARIEQMILDLHLTARQRRPLDGLPLTPTDCGTHDTDADADMQTDDMQTDSMPTRVQANGMPADGTPVGVQSDAGIALRQALSALVERAQRTPARDRPSGIRYARRAKAGSRP